jgi:hypothetical protein
MPLLQWVGGGWAILPTSKIRRPSVNELTNKMAWLVHDIWSRWMKYLFAQCVVNEDGSVTIPADKVKRWTRQMNSDYEALPASEQLSDIDLAHEYIAILDEWIA